jgi:GGDEF domain-containing protein
MMAVKSALRRQAGDNYPRIRSHRNIMTVGNTVLKPVFFSEYIHQLISPEGLEKLEKAVGNRHIGVLSIQIADFYTWVAALGEETGFRLLKILKQCIPVHFDRFFPSASILLLENGKLNENMVWFETAEEGIAGLADASLHYRPHLTRIFSARTSDIVKTPPDIRVGHAWISKNQQAGFYRLLFKAFCDAQRIAGLPIHPAYPSDSHTSASENPAPPRESLQSYRKPDDRFATPIRQLIRPAVTVPPDMTIREVRESLSDLSPMSCIVVLEKRRPVGLLMNYHLDRKLGTPYGVSLYYDREISRLMDPAPLIAEITEAVEEVAKYAMNRESEKLYDDIIVTEEGRFAGTISVQKMLDHLAEIQVKIAMGANPLTGLPGNVAIEQEITRRTAAKLASSLIYIDLDNFKVYNDAYGFDHGDRLILFTARLLKEAVQVGGSPEDFIGHIGGDDFIIIADQNTSPDIARIITDRFGGKAPEFYSEEDRARGFIIGTGRDGIEKEFPFVSVSVGIVDCAFESGISMNELSHRVAAVKKYAKSIPGNAYVKDRRSPLGQTPNSSTVE